MRKDTQVLMRKDLQQLNRFDSCWFLECPCRIHNLCFPESSEGVVQTVVSRHGVDPHERIGKARF